MAGFYTGRTGSLRFGNKQVAKIRDWSLEGTTELLSTNTIDSAHNTFTPGVKGATGSATLLFYRLDGENSSQFLDATSLIRQSRILAPGSRPSTPQNARFEFTLNPGSDNSDRFKFFAYITSASVSVSTGELSTVSINFTVDGYLTDAPDDTNP